MAERLTPRTMDLEVREFKPRPSRCFLRQETLLHFVSLHPGVLMGTGDILLGGNSAIDKHPSRGEYHYSKVCFMVRKPV